MRWVEFNMPKQVVSIVLAVFGACVLAVACEAEESGDQVRKFDPAAEVQHFNMDEETTLSALARLGYAHGLIVCTEDPWKKQGTGPPVRRFSLEFHDTSVESVIEAILEHDDEYFWRVDDGVLNLTSKELQRLDNPFDARIEGFRFEGGPEDFLSKMNQLVPGLAATRRRMLWFTDPEVKLEIPEPTSLREAFNAFARASRMLWHAYVPEGPMTVTIGTQDDPAPIQADVGLWVNVQFVRVDPDVPGK